MKPPRTLWVPFQLGRPFGAPRVPDFQRRVLLTALRLLERSDGPILKDFPDPAPDDAAAGEDSETGWACPVNLGSKNAPVSDMDQFRLRLKQEIALLRPWYEQSVRRQNGRRLDGLTTCSPGEIVDHLVGYLEDPTVPSFVEGEPMARGIKLCADDLKHFYYQAALARPAGASGIAVDQWFFLETLAGKLHFDLRRLLLTMADPALRRVGDMSLIPHTMIHHANDV